MIGYHTTWDNHSAVWATYYMATDSCGYADKGIKARTNEIIDALTGTTFHVVPETNDEVVNKNFGFIVPLNSCL